MKQPPRTEPTANVEELDRLRSEIEARGRAIRALETMLRNRQDHGYRLERKLEQTKARLCQELDATQHNLDQARTEIERKSRDIEALRRDIGAILASTSWRLGKPLRTLGRQLIRLRSRTRPALPHSRGHGAVPPGIANSLSRNAHLPGAAGTSALMTRVVATLRRSCSTADPMVAPPPPLANPPPPETPITETNSEAQGPSTPPQDSQSPDRRQLHGMDEGLFHGSREQGKRATPAPGQRLVQSPADAEPHHRDDRYDPVAEGAISRAAQDVVRERLRRLGRQHWKNKRVLFVLPVHCIGGGANVVISEAHALIEMGVDVHLLNWASSRPGFEQGYPDLDIPMTYVDSESDIPSAAREYDAAVATYHPSVGWLAPLTIGDAAPPRLGYYVQDFEPDFFPPDSWEYCEALASYTRVPSMVCFTKTEWNRDRVAEATGRVCHLVHPSVALDTFRPLAKRVSPKHRQSIRISAMVRPATPWRNAALTMEILRDIQRTHGEHVNIVIFGTEQDDPEFLALPRDFQWRTAGIVHPRQLALLLNEVDIFVDFSRFQAMGLTAMEAMACGAAVIAPQQGGACSFLRHRHNGLLVDTSSRHACIESLGQLIKDTELRNRIRRNAVRDIVRFSPEASAFRIMEVLFPNEIVNRQEIRASIRDYASNHE